MNRYLNYLKKDKDQLEIESEMVSKTKNIFLKADYKLSKKLENRITDGEDKRYLKRKL